MADGIAVLLESANSMFPPAFVNSKRCFGVKFGPYPFNLSARFYCRVLRSLPLDFGGKSRTWSYVGLPNFERDNDSAFGDSNVILKDLA